ESFENVQYLQRGNALTVRRKLENIVAAIIRRDRLHPGGRMLLEVGFSQKAAISPHEIVDLVRDFSFVKNVATFFTDQPQSFSEPWIFENIALGRSAAFAVGRVSFEKRAGQSFIQTRSERPVIGNQFCDRKTFFGISNGGRKVITQF